MQLMAVIGVPAAVKHSFIIITIITIISSSSSAHAHGCDELWRAAEHMHT
jgi:hypothetical protein